MNIAKIAALCKQRKRISLYDKGEGSRDQWISPGLSFYRLTGMPYVEPESCFTLFDIPEDKHEKFFTEHETLPQHVSFEEYNGFDREIYPANMHIKWRGAAYVPFATGAGIEFVQDIYFTPLGDLKDPRFFLRKAEGKSTYIAVKDGLFLCALLKPAEIIDLPLISALNNMACACEYVLEHIPDKEEDEQLSIDDVAELKVNKSTGEVIEE